MTKKQLKTLYYKLKEIYKSTDEFWIFVNTPNENEKINKANETIKEILFPLNFGLMTMLVLILSNFYYEKIGEELNGFAFVFAVFIFLIMAFVVLRIRNSSKHHSRFVPKENSQQLHE